MILFRTRLLPEEKVAQQFCSRPRYRGTPNQSSEFGGQTGTRVMSNRTFFRF